MVEEMKVVVVEMEVLEVEMVVLVVEMSPPSPCSKLLILVRIVKFGISKMSCGVEWWRK
ncbi:hypothetical protein RchiOBHm_Chr5g0026061 [Rosa chinensis]|uniref:Uncharacterized protein n=1 Tax=Rosa chinensis TaxID=74649 RepID=A0A2P6Q8R9_ROSCH|nr:hypothetical protein RchiOBHm_Chr5g0026061 [Rosa chinensis]